jgi:hypothetical protein
MVCARLAHIIGTQSDADGSSETNNTTVRFASTTHGLPSTAAIVAMCAGSSGKEALRPTHDACACLFTDGAHHS